MATPDTYARLQLQALRVTTFATVLVVIVRLVLLRGENSVLAWVSRLVFFAYCAFVVARVDKRSVQAYGLILTSLVTVTVNLRSFQGGGKLPDWSIITVGANLATPFLGGVFGGITATVTFGVLSLISSMFLNLHKSDGLHMEDPAVAAFLIEALFILVITLTCVVVAHHMNLILSDVATAERTRERFVANMVRRRAHAARPSHAMAVADRCAPRRARPGRACHRRHAQFFFFFRRCLGRITRSGPRWSACWACRTCSCATIHSRRPRRRTSTRCGAAARPCCTLSTASWTWQCWPTAMWT